MSVSPRSPAKRRKLKAAKVTLAAKNLDTLQQAATSHSSKSLSHTHRQPSRAKSSRQHEASADMADPLAAFASRTGLRHRSLQSGLKLLNGKASGTVDPSLQPAHCPVPDQLARQQGNVPKAYCQRKHQDHKMADSLQQFAYKPHQKQARSNGTGNSQQQDLTPICISKGASQNPSRASKGLQQASPVSKTPLVHVAKTLDPNYMQNLKHSLCQLMQGRHQVKLQSASPAEQKSLVSLLASKLDGVDISAALTQYQQDATIAVRKPDAVSDNVNQQAHSAAKSSVACTPSPEPAAHQNVAAECRPVPDQAMSCFQQQAVNTACSPASHVLHPDLSSTSTSSSHKTSSRHKDSDMFPDQSLHISHSVHVRHGIEAQRTTYSRHDLFPTDFDQDDNNSIDMLFDHACDEPQPSALNSAFSADCHHSAGFCQQQQLQIATPSAQLNRCRICRRQCQGICPPVMRIFDHASLVVVNYLLMLQCL